MLKFVKASEARSVEVEEQDQVESFEEEKLKLLKAWRTFLVVCSSFQVRSMSCRTVQMDVTIYGDGEEPH